MSNETVFKKNMDFVLCIDATGSMVMPIEALKNNLFKWRDKVCDEFYRQYDLGIGEIRFKIIAFRDYASDQEPMQESRFFVLGREDEELKRFVNGLTAEGGGDRPENALEALALAAKSDWLDDMLRYHVVMMLTDAPALEFGARKDCNNYPSDMPKNIKEFEELWCSSVPHSSRRLIVFAPEHESWDELRETDSCACMFWPSKQKEWPELITPEFIVKLIRADF